MNATSRSARTVLPFIVGVGACVVLAIVNQGRGFELWRNYALSGFVLGSGTTFALYHYDVRVPHYIQWVIVAGLMFHYIGGSLGSPNPYEMGLFGFHGINGAYHTFEWWDHLTHGVGVGAATMAAAYLVEIYQMRRGLAWSSTGVWFVALLVGLALGVGVELYEFLGKSAFQTIDQGGYENTMRDLHYNVFGAALGGAIATTVDRGRLARRIEKQWGRPAANLAGQRWSQRVPPAMAGLIAFVAPAAAMTTFLSLRFLVQDVPTETPRAYADALRAMLACAIGGAILGPAVGLFWPRASPGEAAT